MNMNIFIVIALALCATEATAEDQLNVPESNESLNERTQLETKQCLQKGEQNLMAVNVPQEIINLEQLGQYHQLLGYRLSELIPFTPQGKQLCSKVTAQFRPYKVEEYIKACKDYETATSEVLKQSECSLLELVSGQAQRNAKFLGENNGVRKFNLYRMACHLLSIA